MNKIVIVVADGTVETVFVNKGVKAEVEIVDFDSAIYDFDESEKLGDYVDECRETMTEISC